ncbi:MAG: 2-phospho-L-lactate transferase [Pseudomonadales bacterium]|nr:2-phospho-L-lactate transferase [Pseudomonadales bacterium]MCP5182325.1 2-phospho-L-lactate transferase [Pseudomonadales bacterium]
MARYLAITGGVGGAKLALGLAHVLTPDEVLFVVNTGDDFEHLGLAISPDLDTLTYTLADLNNTELGWGRRDETWQCLDTLAELGGESWFRLGDRDLALHFHRTQLLRAGASLSQVTAEIARRLGIRHGLAPMSDQPIRTIVHTAKGALNFQHYFVRDRCAPAVTGFHFDGIPSARLSPVVADWLTDCQGVIICPSNPFVSVDPVLAVPGMREALARLPVVAVSPIVDGMAIKGPTAKMMAELKVPATAAQVASHYGELLTGFVLDEADAAVHDTLPVRTVVTRTVMLTLQDRIDLARVTVEFLQSLAH